MERRRFLLGLVGAMAIAALIPWTFNVGTGLQSAPAFGAYYANSPQGGVSGTALQKFVNALPGLGPANANNLGQYIPVAVPDTTTFPGSDYYVIGVGEHQEHMHSNLPGAGCGTGTHLRGYYQINGPDTSKHYLGPLIVAQRDRPVRLKVVNNLPAGKLWLPEDSTLMGAVYDDGVNPVVPYAQNRIAVHLHGGATPWISDGTPHQWFTPVGTGTAYNINRGVSFQNVPDMWFDAAGNVVPQGTPGATNDPGVGAATFYYTNQQSGRLMFYHDHASAITHYNVYAGMAAGYILRDPVEEALVTSQVIPSHAYEIPLIIQDKTFVPNNITTQGDPAWDPVGWGFPPGTGLYGDLWLPHVYEPNQAVNAGPNSPPRRQVGLWPLGFWFYS
jgi:hypothetical protein